MSLFDRIFGKKDKSAAVAKDRLKVMLVRERAACIPNVEEMEVDLSKVLQKYVDVRNLQIKTESNQNIDMIEIEVQLKQ